VITPDLDGIPLYLVTQDRWLLWRSKSEIDRKTGKTIERKIPISGHTGKPCDATDPRNWTDFASVKHALDRKTGAWDGPGLALGPIESLAELLIGLDLDGCLDENDALAPWAMPFLVAFGSYSERSPGECGIKSVGRIRYSDLAVARRLLDIGEGSKEQARTRTFGSKPPDGGHAPGAQLFLMKRYFAITGRHWLASPEDVILLTIGQIATLGTLFGPKEQRTPTPSQTNGASENDEKEPEEAELRSKLAVAFGRNPRLRERWEGGVEGLSDTTRSGRDMSVLAMLVAAGFTKDETHAALKLFDHGKLKEERPRYFEQMWSHTKARPRVEPEVPPDFDERFPPEAERVVWPETIDCFAPLHLLPAPVTADEAPPALWPFISDTALRMGVSTSTPTLGSLVTCSAVISDEWRLQPKRHDYLWTENARIWGAIVGPPSILKTPVINACTHPVDQLEAEGRRQWQEDMRRYEEQLAKWEKNGSDADDKPQAPKRARWLVESTTIEALQEVLRDDAAARFTAPAKKILVRQDELSEFLANLDRYTSGRSGGDRGAYLRLYNGGPYSIDRIGRGSFTTSSWSGCLLGGIQPEPIQRIARDAVDDGLLQRMVYDVPPSETNGGIDCAPNQSAIERYRRLIPTLAALRPASSSDGHTRAVVLHADAHGWRESVDEMTRNVATMPDVSARLQSALGKWPGLFARLCLTFHLIEVADARVSGNIGTPIGVVSAVTAERVARYMRQVLLRHLLRADAVMFASVQTGHAKWIAGHILAHQLDRITVRDVIRAYVELRSPEARDVLHNVMASLVSIGWVDPEPPRNPLNPVSAWRVNPHVHRLYVDQAGKERQERRQRAEETIARRQAHVAPTR
jgi:Protein of unknown function (DUF3987)